MTHTAHGNDWTLYFGDCTDPESQDAWVFDDTDAEAEIEARVQQRLAQRRVEHRSALEVGRDDWCTPEKPILERVRGIAPIGLDPCTTQENTTGAARFYTAEDDGLKQSWAGEGLRFINFPYSQAGLWVAKIVAEARTCPHTIVLPAARPGSGWYRTLQAHCGLYVELEKRVKFVGAESTAPFPTAVFYDGEDEGAFLAAFGDLGVALRVQRLQATRRQYGLFEVGA